MAGKLAESSVCSKELDSTRKGVFGAAVYPSFRHNFEISLFLSLCSHNILGDFFSPS